MKPVSLKGKSREEWLELRKHGIGGSEAAAILGLNPYMTPYTVWAEKTNRLPEKEDTEAMRLGRDLEEYVAKRFTEKTGKRVKRRNAILWHEEYPFMFANADRFIVGENAGLECKTTSTLNLKQFKNGEYPDTYYCQCMHYMAVTGYRKWYLAVLVLGKEFLVYEINRDEDEIRSLVEAEKAFWNYVVKDTPPPVDGRRPTTKTIHTIYREAEPGKIELFGEDSHIKTLLELGKEMKALSTEKERIEQHLKELLGNCEFGQSDKFTVSWKNQTRRNFSVERLLEDHPDIDINPYYKKTEYRKFEVKELR